MTDKKELEKNHTQEKKARHQLFFDIHSWAGISCGLLLFIVCFSGIPAVFDHEIAFWQFPEYEKISQQYPESKQPGGHYNFDLEKIMQVAKHNDFAFDRFFIAPAEPAHPLHRIAHFGENKVTQLYIHPVNYQVIEHNGSDASHVLAHLHTDLHLPHPYGRYLVGLVGMVLLLMLIAGVLLHKKWKKEAISIRPKRSMRLQLIDHHKIIGLWTLPFTVILTFTGTILGLLGIIAPILALAKFDGDVDKARAAIVGPQAVLQSEPAQHQPLNDFLIKQKSAQPNSNLEFIQITGYHDKGGVIQFSGSHNSALSSIQSATFSLNSGELIHKADSTQQGIFQRLFAAVTPLHYVLFGDLALKFFYAISGLALCLLILTGNIMWLIRRGHDMQHWLSKITLGVSGGLVFATLALFAAVPMIQIGILSMLSSDFEQLEFYSFFAFWLIAIIFPWLFKLNAKTLLRTYLRSSILVTVIALLLDFNLQGSFIGRSQMSLVVPMLISALAALLIYFDLRLNKIMDR